MTKVKSDVFENEQQNAESLAAGSPQIASPVSTFHITNLLSSSPPNVATYLFDALNEIAWILVLYKLSLCNTLRDSKSQIHTDAFVNIALFFVL